MSKIKENHNAQNTANKTGAEIAESERIANEALERSVDILTSIVHKYKPQAKKP